MTEGATVGGFANKPDGYDFVATYTTLEAAYSGQHKFGPRVEPLSNSEAQLTLLPNPNVGVLNAKYLIESFVIPNMENSKAFIDNFASYSGTVCSTIATVHRAIDHLSKSLKTV